MFKHYFGRLTDPRRQHKGNFRYPLIEIVFLFFIGALAGKTTYLLIMDFGKKRLSWLRKFFPYRNGIPSDDTLRRVMIQVIDPQEFVRASVKFLQKLLGSEYQFIAIDGKTVRGSSDRGRGQEALHIVSSYARELQMALAQCSERSKGKEAPLIRQLLEQLDLSGKLVTIDAIGCQREFAQKIKDKGGEYIFALKENQSELLRQIELSFRLLQPLTKTYVDKEGGWIVTKRVSVLQDLRFVDDKEQWQGLKSLVRIEKQRYNKATGQRQQSVRYYISSIGLDSELAQQLIRGHWSIENQLHKHLDVAFKEDASRRRLGNSVENFNILFKLVLSILQHYKPMINKSLARIFNELTADTVAIEAILSF